MKIAYNRVNFSRSSLQIIDHAIAILEEYAIRRIIANDRRFLYHDMPKGEADTLAWKTGPLIIPGHD